MTAPSTEKVIAPCPFCGSEASIGKWKDAIDQSDTAPTAIECSSGLDDCPVNPSVARWTREEAIAAWNRRLSTPAAGDAVMVFAEHHNVALRSLADKFASGNSVPVDRATILRTEWDAICAFVRDQETILDDREERLTALAAGIEGLEAKWRQDGRFAYSAILRECADDLNGLREGK